MSTSVVQEEIEEEVLVMREEQILPVKEEEEVQQSEPSEELQNILAVQDYEEQKLAEELKVEHHDLPVNQEPEEQKQEIEIETSEEELKMREEEVKTHILAKGDDLQEFDKALEEEKKFIG